jgi:hypothetical protein
MFLIWCFMGDGLYHRLSVRVANQVIAEASNSLREGVRFSDDGVVVERIRSVFEVKFLKD